MTNEKKCPVCNSTVTYFGEGGYGKCSNGSCVFEEKIEGCETISCDDASLQKKEDIHTAND
ncbi:MAG: hypothetical protein WBA54_11085 [Acidaminobacteraceae bacterium]